MTTPVTKNESVYSLMIQTDKVSIKPHEIESGIKNNVKRYLTETFEGSINQSGLYVIKIIDIDINCIKNGTVNELNGSVVYSIDYSIFVFDPVINGVFEAIITKCNDIGVWSRPLLCPESKNKDSKECIVECITTSNMIINKDKDKIKVGNTIKFKVLNRKIDFTKMSVFGMII